MPPKKNWLLRIPAAIYGSVVGIRNFAFDKGILHSEKSSIPTICVGNLAVGGTGKTPHIELLIRLLQDEYKLALLSRGYGRVTKEPIIATSKDTALTIGDEPFQIKRKFPHLMVYIDGNRLRALKHIEQLPENERPDVVLMDDGFQHRSVIPSFSIILTAYNNLYTQDTYLPYGTLRDNPKEASRADTIIITNTPRQVTPVDLRIKRDELNLLAFQHQYFSRVRYESPKCLFTPSEGGLNTPEIAVENPVIILSGIAHPEAFQQVCQLKFKNIHSFIEYPDHHKFSQKDIEDLTSRLLKDPSLNILTTEKDAMRILACEMWIPPQVKSQIWYIPIYIEISPDCKMGLLNKAKRAIKNNGLTI